MTDFSSKDFSSTYEAMLDFIGHLTTRWDPSTSSEADPGVALLKAFALKEDTQEYARDAARNQGYLDSVTNRQDAFDLLQSFGYSMKSAKSATGSVQITLRGKLPEGVTEIPARTVFTDISGKKTYFSINSVPLYGANSLATISATKAVGVSIIEGSPIQIIKSGIDIFTLKDIDESGRFFLQRSNLAANGIFIYELIDGKEQPSSNWKLVDSSAAFPQGKYFTLRTSTTGEDYIQFPFDFSTQLGATQFVVYATSSSGVAGAVPKNTLIKSNLSSTFVVNQDQPTTHGQDAQTVQQAIEDYYRTKETFNVLVSHHDYESAIRLLAISQDNLFPACWADTNISKQQAVKARFLSLVYFFYPSSAWEAFPSIEVLRLTASQDYASSYRVVSGNEKVETQIKLNEMLSRLKQVGAYIKLVDKPRILAVTSLKGEIKHTAAESLLAEVLAQIAKAYNSTSAYFGKELDYEAILSLLKAVNPQILSAALEMLEYQVYLEYDEVDGKTTTIPVSSSSDEITLTKVAAYSVVKGDIPLFKFLNRRNASCKPLSGYIPVRLGTDSFSQMSYTNIKSFYVDDKFYPAGSVVTEFNPIITEIKPNFEIQHKNAEGGIVTLVKSQVLQVNKPLKAAGTEYGQGIKYAFTAPSVSLSSNTQISSYSYVLAGSKLKGSGKDITVSALPTKLNNIDKVAVEGTLIVSTENVEINGSVQGLKGTVSADGTISWETAIATIGKLSDNQVAILKDDCTLVGTLYLGNKSVLIKDTIPAEGSVINSNIHGAIILPDQEYQLKTGQKISLKTPEKEALVELSSGAWIKVSGTTLKSSGSVLPNQLTPLTSGQSIATLEDRKYEIGTEYLYFLKLKKAVTELNLATPYMLDDQEFFVYADASRTEYIQLGSGTILSAAEGSLTNIVSIMTEETPDLFESLPFKVTAQQTETVTFQEGDKVKFTDTTPSLFKDSSLPLSFTSLGNANLSASLTYYKEDGTTQVYEYPYSIRMVCVFMSDINSLVEIPFPVVLKLQPTITVDKPGTSTNTNLGPIMTLGSGSVDASGNPSSALQYLSLSTPIYFVADGTKGASLLPPGKTALISSFKRKELVTKPPDAAQLYLSGNSVKITIIKDIVQSHNEPVEVPISLPLIPNVKAILARINIGKAKFNMGVTVKFSLKPYRTDGAQEVEQDVVKDFTYVGYNDRAEYTIHDTDIDSIIIIPILTYPTGTAKEDATRLIVKFSSSESISLFGRTVTIYDIAYIDDFSDEIKYLTDIEAPDYYNPTLTAPKYDVGNNSPSYLIPDANYGEKLLAEIRLKGARSSNDDDCYDYLCDPSIPYEHPTASASYFNKEHPYNSKTIAFISLKETEKNLRLTKRR